MLDYEFHPETKNGDANGNASGKQTIGLLQRRHVRIKQIKYIGKESNLIDDVESGLVQSETDICTEYTDARRDEWETEIRPALRKISLAALKKESGISRRTLIYARTGKRRPHPKYRELLASILRKFALI